MSTPYADRNLLFGILALQMDFVTRGQLVAAMNAWVMEKEKPLGQILTDQGALDARDRALLEPMVRRHVERHGNDAERSLAALSSDPELRASLERLGDPELGASLLHVGEDRRGEADPGSTQTYAGASTPPSVRFRVLRYHAGGGLGEVYVARDEELNREVALKQIRDRYADDARSRSRFLVEAEVTGGLEHPGIVPVYGLGCHDNGRPFYAMRFIKGDSLEDAIRRFYREAQESGRDPGQHALELQKLLRRFLDVCNAVAYAHSRGVLHRDLKPGNIMLGPYGETLVVDWGLAKVIGRDDSGGVEETLRPALEGDATLPGSLVGTLAYMSPEQAAGDLSRLGPGSDVYSLGAILYILLTGRVAIATTDVAEARPKILRGEFPPPRQVARDVSPALEAVCLKAMSLRPEDRYATPRALADEIESWLADEPVGAWHEPRFVRVRRWARRHRPLVSGAAGLLVALTAVSAVAALLLKRANDATERRRAEAVAHRATAERNFSLARDAVDRFYTRVSEDRLLNEPHMVRLRRELLGTAREFYQKFADERKDDPRSRADLGNAYLRLAKICGELAENREAIGYALRAREIFGKLTTAHFDVVQYQHSLAEADYRLGLLFGTTGRWAEAESSYRRAIEVQEKLAAAHPEVIAHQRDLAQSFNDLGVFLANESGRITESLAPCQRALEIRKKLAEAHPEVAAYQDDLSGSYHNLGDFHRRARRWKEAEAAYKRALEIQQKPASAHPEVTEYRSGLAHTHCNLGILFKATGRNAEAEGMYQRALEIQEKLAVEHPEVALFQRLLAQSLNDLGAIYRNTGQTSKAEAVYKRALEIRKKLVAAHPEVTLDRSVLSQTYHDLGIIHLATGHTAEAETACERAIEIREKLVAEHPEGTELQLNLAGSYHNLGEFCRTSRPAKAEAAYKRAIEINEGLAAARPGDAQPLVDLAGRLDRLGVFYRNSGSASQAEATYKRALEIRKKLVAAHPDVPAYRSGLARAYEELGIASNAAGRRPEAEAAHQRAVEVRQKLVAEHPEGAQYQRDLAETYRKLGQFYQITGRSSGAEAAYKRAIKVREKLVAAHPEVIPDQNDLARTLNDLGVVLITSRRSSEAEVAFMRSIEVHKKLATSPKKPPDNEVDLASACNNLGNLLLERDEPESALVWYTRALEPLKAMPSGGTGKALPRRPFFIAHRGRARALDRLDRPAESIADWDLADAFAEDRSRDEIRMGRAIAIARSGDYERAAAEAGGLANAASLPPGMRSYNLACIYALASAAARNDRALRPERRDARAEQYAVSALGWLNRARLAGFFRDPAATDHFRNDRDLDPLRSHTAFQLFLMDLAFPDDPFARESHGYGGGSSPGWADFATIVARRSPRPSRSEPETLSRASGNPLAMSSSVSRQGAHDTSRTRTGGADSAEGAPLLG